ncbi:MAG: hypothetical protein LBK52_01170, partial [Deltaproteobacteria bacterium]|nr:hypothetical protein [Deltaproteobacteria bacterium]
MEAPAGPEPKRTPPPDFPARHHPRRIPALETSLVLLSQGGPRAGGKLLPDRRLNWNQPAGLPGQMPSSQDSGS